MLFELLAKTGNRRLPPDDGCGADVLHMTPGHEGSSFMRIDEYRTSRRRWPDRLGRRGAGADRSGTSTTACHSFTDL